MKLLYFLGVSTYTIAVHIASVWNSKARKLLKGRRNVWKDLSHFKPGEMVVWFHCASLGEFEQGRPLMEEIKTNQKCQIVLTFFSPSGYEVRKNYAGADLVIYLPKDSRKNARRFLNAVQPSQVFFVKYEFWANYIFECGLRNIPIYSVAALFRKDQIFFRNYGGFMRSVLKAFTQIFVQNEASRDLLESIHIQSTVCGDTRYDRVMKNAEKVIKYPEVANFCDSKKVLVCGSIWDEDLEVIAGRINQLGDWKIIIAPHEISEKFISRIEGSIKRKSIRYSRIDFLKDEAVLIIDNVGMLMNLYQYGDVAFVGGGYRTGLHNILEPAAFGLPVFFGNRVEKFPEAATFIENGIGFVVEDSKTFEQVFDEVQNKVTREQVKAFMQSKRGATDVILKSLISIS